MKARFDGYLASDTPLAPKQVLFLFGHRCVVMEQFTDRERWQAERLSRRPPKEATPGFIQNGGTVTTPSPPPNAGYFYGVNWLPEEV